MRGSTPPEADRLTIVGAVFARGGSKGLPGKNLKRLGGKPLIGWSIDHLRGCPRVGRVIVSTDDQEIAAAARDFGAEVPFLRPGRLARDDSPEWLAWRHAIVELEAAGPPIDLLVSAPATGPLRSPEDLERVIELALEEGVDAATTVTPARANPYYSMVVRDETGFARIAVAPERPLYRRQDAPVLYDLAGTVYAARARFVLRAEHLFAGRVKTLEVPAERAVDIDRGIDFQLAELLLAAGSGAEAGSDSK